MNVAAAPPVQKGLLASLAKVNELSFLAQVVQIGAVPALLALRLQNAGAAAYVVGLVAAAPWAVILLFGRLVPGLLQRMGLARSNWLALGISLCAVIGMTATVEPIALFALNLLLGAGLILRWVACDTWIVVLAPAEMRGRALGVHETLMGCGIAGGPLVLALLGADGAAPFIACASLLLLAALPLLFLARNDAHPVTPAGGRFTTLAGIIPTALAAGALAGFVETSSISFLPVMGERGDLALHAAAVLAGFGVGGTALQLPIGWLADRGGYRTAQLIVATLVASGAIGLATLRAEPLLLQATLFVWGGAVGGMNTLAVVEAGHRVPASAASTAMTFIAMSYTVGSILGPVLTGLATERLPALGLPLTAGLAAVMFLALWTRGRKTN